MQLKAKQWIFHISSATVSTKYHQHMESIEKGEKEGQQYELTVREKEGQHDSPTATSQWSYGTREQHQHDNRSLW